MTAVALTVAGSDSGGGAGIQADLKTFAALGVYGLSAIAALTAQNTRGVSGIHDVPADFIAAQIDAVFADFDIGAVKIGMLSRPQAIRVVAERLGHHAARNIVVDPVMVASSGDRLLAPDAVEVLRRDLLPLAAIATPNIPEAAVLTGRPPASSLADMEAQARDILGFGCAAVLLKGGHGTGAESVDVLASGEGVIRMSAPRVATRSTHGTGCTLSSAIAAGLAKGEPLVDAVRAAKIYVTAAIAAADGLTLGNDRAAGHGPLHHFHKYW